MGETSKHDQSEPIKPESEKEILWEQKRREIDEIKDKLGKGVDENIKEAVTAFRVFEFTTSGSCGGHLQKEKHGLLYPWVDISAPIPEGFKESEGEDREKKEARMEK